MVENFGSYLKHERELRGVPLEEISGATKIHIRFLKALEENSFDQLPGEVFIKGYIRSYANVIGSDVEEMLNIYEESVGRKNQENTSEEISASKAQPKTILAYGLLILLIVGLLFGVGFLIKTGAGGDKPEEEKASSLQKQVVVPEPSISSSLSEKPLVEENMDIQGADSADLEISAQEHFVISSEDVDEKKVSPPQESVELTTVSASLPDLDPQNPTQMEKPLKLLVRAKENSWFNMTIDGFKEEDFILPAGTAKAFWGDETFRLTVGNKAGVELFLNGTILTLPESEDRVVKDFIINSKLIE